MKVSKYDMVVETSAGQQATGGQCQRTANDCGDPWAAGDKM